MKDGITRAVIQRKISERRLSVLATPPLTLPSPPLAGGLAGGEGRCEKIQFWLPSLVRRGPGGGRKSQGTNPLESPLTKGDTREAEAKSIFSQLQWVGVRGRCAIGPVMPLMSLCLAVLENDNH